MSYSELQCRLANLGHDKWKSLQNVHKLPPKMDAASRRLVDYMILRANQYTGQFNWAPEAMAGEVGMHERTCYRHRDKLEAAGVIIRCVDPAHFVGLTIMAKMPLGEFLATARAKGDNRRMVINAGDGKPTLNQDWTLQLIAAFGIDSVSEHLELKHALKPGAIAQLHKLWCREKKELQYPLLAI